MLKNQNKAQPAGLEAYASLRAALKLEDSFPYTEKWSASPDFLQTIVDHCLKTRPATILECGSGLTTLMLARCCQLNGRGHIYSLENGAEFAGKTRSFLAAYGLQEFASVLDAPLETKTINGMDYQWYATAEVPRQDIDMLVIDGPPGFIQRHSRYPAFPLLSDKLSPGCRVFLDDAARSDEREIVELWKSEYPGTKHEYLELERGCSVLTINKDG